MTTRESARPWRTVALYATGLALLVLTPIGHVLNPITVELYVLFRYRIPIAPDWMLPEHYGALLNVLLFVPLGWLAQRLTERPWWQVALAGLALSLGIEIVQLTLLPRVADPWDVASNTLGAALGGLAAQLAHRHRSGL